MGFDDLLELRLLLARGSALQAAAGQFWSVLSERQLPALFCSARANSALETKLGASNRRRALFGREGFHCRGSAASKAPFYALKIIFAGEDPRVFDILILGKQGKIF